MLSLQSEIAVAHQDQRRRLASSLGFRLGQLWQGIPVDDLDAGWDFVAPRMVQQVAVAQRSAAVQATAYSAALDDSFNVSPPRTALNVDAFTNVMGDGREVAPALFGAVAHTKQLIGGGVEARQAFRAGAAFLGVVARAAVNDLGRAADQSLAGGKGYTRYVRVVNAGACSRCAILAGVYTSAQTFRRHVGCQCTSVPLPGDRKPPAGLMTDPSQYFDSLSAAEQNRVFTNAGAEAIRAGADPVAVVNARRGAYGIGYSGRSTLPSLTRNRLQPITIGRRADGSPLRVFATTEGTTARGAFGRSELRLRRTTTVRLMPEQIVKMAEGNPQRMRELLTRYGYIN